MLHTFIPEDMILNGICESKSEYIKYNGIVCQISKNDGNSVIERIISTNPKDYLIDGLIGKKITKLL